MPQIIAKVKTLFVKEKDITILGNDIAITYGYLRHCPGMFDAVLAGVALSLKLDSRDCSLSYVLQFTLKIVTRIW